jgi:acyl-CoA synthetase (AMP-forming)/AMP-acid ligase II
MRAFLDAACASRGGAPYLVFRGRTWSYAETGAITDSVAAELLALGIAPGDRLAMQLPTGPEHLILWLATAKAGIVSCPLHTELARLELESALSHLTPRGFVDASGTLTIGGRTVATFSELAASRRALSGADAPKPEAIATILEFMGKPGIPRETFVDDSIVERMSREGGFDKKK